MIIETIFRHLHFFFFQFKGRTFVFQLLIKTTFFSANFKLFLILSFYIKHGYVFFYFFCKLYFEEKSFFFFRSFVDSKIIFNEIDTMVYFFPSNSFIRNFFVFIFFRVTFFYLVAAFEVLKER